MLSLGLLNGEILALNKPFHCSKVIFTYHFNLLFVFLLFSGMYTFLERMCLHGTRKQAKFAVSAIVSSSSEHSVVSKLFEVHIFGWILFVAL